MHHLTRYELGDGEGDNLGGTVDVGDHAARFRSGEATEIGAQTQLDLVRVDGVDVKVDGHLRGAAITEPVQQCRAGATAASGVGRAPGRLPVTRTVV